MAEFDGVAYGDAGAVEFAQCINTVRYWQRLEGFMGWNFTSAIDGVKKICRLVACTLHPYMSLRTCLHFARDGEIHEVAALAELPPLTVPGMHRDFTSPHVTDVGTEAELRAAEREGHSELVS